MGPGLPRAHAAPLLPCTQTPQVASPTRWPPLPACGALHPARPHHISTPRLAGCAALWEMQVPGQEALGDWKLHAVHIKPEVRISPTADRATASLCLGYRGMRLCVPGRDLQGIPWLVRSHCDKENGGYYSTLRPVWSFISLDRGSRSVSVLVDWEFFCYWHPKWQNQAMLPDVYCVRSISHFWIPVKPD